MTAHDLARQLLAGPDLPVVLPHYDTDDEYATGEIKDLYDVTLRTHWTIMRRVDHLPGWRIYPTQTEAGAAAIRAGALHWHSSEVVVLCRD